MAGREEAAEGSRRRRRMDPNLYLGLPPLPRPPGRLGAAMDHPIIPVADAPAGLPAPLMEMPPLPEVYSPSNALSTPELSPIDPALFDWLDGLSSDSEDPFDANEPAVAFAGPSHAASVSPPPQLPLAGLAGVPLECLEGFSNPLPFRGIPAAGTEMVSTRWLRSSTGGAIEDMAPELRLQRLIQVSDHHRIIRPRPGVLSRNRRSTSPEAERLVQAIHQSHLALDAKRRQKLDAAVDKDGNCGCNSGFDCNICYDAAKEPVVTPCGHLFCWPCLYKWLNEHSVHSECPVCKGEVLEVNVTPIYGRGDDEQGASRNGGPPQYFAPPRPSANRTESFRQQLQVADPRGIASLVRQLMENQDIVTGHAAPPVGGVEVTVAARSRARVGRQQRRNIASLPGNAAPQIVNQVQFPSFNSNNNAAPTDPQQSSSMEQASTSSTMAVMFGQAAQSRRSRPSESTTTRRTRRRQQQ